MGSIKERGFTVFVVAIIILLTAPMIAYADDCDKTFKSLEVYDCKMGRVEHKVGLKTDTKAQCVENRKLNVTGCTVEALATDTATHYIYIIGPEKTRKAFNDFKWQCDNDAGNAAGGLDKSRFEGQWAPGYTFDKYPSESNNDRSERFVKDLAKQGKAMYGGLILSQPTTKYTKKFDKQVCQYFNVKTNAVALKFNCDVDFKEKGAATPAAAEEGKKGGAVDSVQKGLQGIFGR